MKRFLAILLSVMLLASLAVTASAEGVTLKGFSLYQPDATASVTDFNDMISWKTYTEKFGVNFEWTHVSSGQADQIALIISSGELPDFIMTVAPKAAVEYGVQGAFMRLNEVIDQYMPNFKALLDANPELRASITSPDGSIYFIPRAMVDEHVRQYTSWAVRTDWLEKLGKSVPTTTDEMYDVLKALKASDLNENGIIGDEVGYMGNIEDIIALFDVGTKATSNAFNALVEDGKIVFGPTDPKYKVALEYCHKLYSEGLIDPDFPNNTSGKDAIATTVGNLFCYGSVNGMMGKYNKLLGKLVYEGMVPPATEYAEGVNLSGHPIIDAGFGSGICSTTEHLEEVAKMFDYWFSEEGQLLFYFGIEGETYTMVDGVPTYVDAVAHAPNITLNNYINTYIGFYSTMSANVPSATYQQTLLANGQNSVDANNIATEHRSAKKVPNLIFSADEILEMGTLETDINTYVSENAQKFVRGDRSLDEFDAFVSDLQRMGVDHLVSIYQAAYDRFLEAAGK